MDKPPIVPQDVIGELRELDMLGADNPTNHQGQGVQMLLVVAIAPRVQHLRQGPFDGTIGLEADVHGILRSSGLVTMTSGYHCASASVYRIAIRSRNK